MKEMKAQKSEIINEQKIHAQERMPEHMNKRNMHGRIGCHQSRHVK